MYKELESKVFILKNYNNRDEMEQYIKEYVKMLKIVYPKAIVTREFYKIDGILVRATQFINNEKTTNIELERDEEVRIKEKGINGLGENVDRKRKNEKSREKEIRHSFGNERERGGR